MSPYLILIPEVLAGLALIYFIYENIKFKRRFNSDLVLVYRELSDLIEFFDRDLASRTKDDTRATFRVVTKALLKEFRSRFMENES
jgi:hypothetical protein